MVFVVIVNDYRVMRDGVPKLVKQIPEIVQNLDRRLVINICGWGYLRLVNALHLFAERFELCISGSGVCADSYDYIFMKIRLLGAQPA